MLRRSLNEHTNSRQCTKDNKANPTRKVSKKRYSSTLSSSTLFGFCAISAILCFAIQTRIYSDTIHEQKPNPFQPRTGNGNQHPDRYLELPPLRKEEFQLGDQAVNDIISDEIKPGSSPSELRQKEKGAETTVEEDESQARTFPPRIVYYYEHYHDNSHNVDGLDLKHPPVLLSDDIKEVEQKVTEIELVNEEPARDKEIDNKASGNTTNDADDVDDEDQTALENKDAIQTENEESNQEECVPLASWQSSVPVNCNTLHEIDLLSSILNTGKKSKKHLRQDKPILNITSQIHHDWSSHPTWNESQVKFLGQGWFRAAWKLDRQPPGFYSYDDSEEQDDDGETVILKMLRPERDFTAEFYELHRIDAVAMEQLTRSKFVLDVYGYCGQSALNEFASFRIPELSSLEKFDRQLRGKNSPAVNRMKLKLAISVATGVAHIHELPADLVDDDRPAMSHYDLNPRNVAIVRGGMPKLNDFNVAHFLKYNPKTNQTCGFDSRLHEPWWRAPEEVSLNATGKLTHAVDVWSLGNLLFHILTTHSPRGKMKDYRMEEVRQVVLKGIPPALPTEYLKSKDPVVDAFRQAMELCFVKDPNERASARDVANVLYEEYLQIMEAQKEKKKEKGH